LTPQERLKRKMQAQLSKTFKEEKKSEQMKAEVKEVERIVSKDSMISLIHPIGKRREAKRRNT
jgi:hypothetical protein